MAANTLPKSIAELLDLADHCYDGLSTYGSSLGIVQYTTTTLGTKKSALASKQGLFNAARAAYAGAFDPIHVVQAQMRAACLTARKILSISFGDAWSADWVPAGWISATTEVPADLVGLKALCTALSGFLGSNAAYEVDTAKITFTAASFSALLSALAPLETALAGAKTLKDSSGEVRKTFDAALRDELGGLIDLLGRLLGPNDARWDAFGLNRPGASVTPGAPGAPTLSKLSATVVHAVADAVTGATYYRWFSQLTGVDTEFRFIGRTHDPMIDLPGQPATGTLKVKLQAANEAGPGVASPVSTIVLG